VTNVGKLGLCHLSVSSMDRDCIANYGASAHVIGVHSRSTGIGVRVSWRLRIPMVDCEMIHTMGFGVLICAALGFRCTQSDAFSYPHSHINPEILKSLPLRPVNADVIPVTKVGLQTFSESQPFESVPMHLQCAHPMRSRSSPLLPTFHITTLRTCHFSSHQRHGGEISASIPRTPTQCQVATPCSPIIVHAVPDSPPPTASRRRPPLHPRRPHPLRQRSRVLLRQLLKRLFLVILHHPPLLEICNLHAPNKSAFIPQSKPSSHPPSLPHLSPLAFLSHTGNIPN